MSEEFRSEIDAVVSAVSESFPQDLRVAAMRELGNRLTPGSLEALLQIIKRGNQREEQVVIHGAVDSLRGFMDKDRLEGEREEFEPHVKRMHELATDKNLQITDEQRLVLGA